MTKSCWTWFFAYPALLVAMLGAILLGSIVGLYGEIFFAFALAGGAAALAIAVAAIHFGVKHGKLARNLIGLCCGLLLTVVLLYVIFGALVYLGGGWR